MSRSILEGEGWGRLAGGWRTPLAELRIETGSGPEALAAIDGFLRAQSALGRSTLGAIGYELGRELEPRVRATPPSDLPLVVLRAFAGPPSPIDSAAPPRTARAELRPVWSQSEYAARFERLQAWIHAGDVYQANLAVPFEARLEGTAEAFGRRLAAAHPMPFHAELDLGGFRLVSNSPERFLVRRGTTLETTPIKGTRPRSPDAAEDERSLTELEHDPKERAEHVMIVDLERSDLGRLARIGSVTVPRFAVPATYPTLHHLESSVRAEVAPTVTFAEILRATFPGGSITGAPKIRAMQILGELEERPRGFFTGAIVAHEPSGDFVASLAIRTATILGDRIRFAAGGGIVADSRADAEWAECGWKARAFVEAGRASGGGA